MTTQTEQHLKAWVPAGYRLLMQTAGSYRAVVTSSELAAGVQEATGLGRGVRPTWVGQLLEIVAMQAHRSGDAPLASLCVQSDGSVGERYRKALLATGVDVTDVEQRAAEDRLECYRRYATDLPADGGVPRVLSRTPRATSSSPRPRATPRPERPAPAICPTCFMQLPATGVCDSCG